MKIPVQWLKDYVKFDIGVKELADKLTLSGSNMEEIITSGEEIQNVVTGRIEKIEPHPDADKLVICQVNVGHEEFIQIVTGAKNMREKDIVPVALHGAVLSNGLKIKKGKLRGIVSNGMMCSEEELGIAGDEPVHGLMILPENTEIGKDIKEALNLNKATIDFDITSNRPDCLSIIGMARETSATLGIPYKLPSMDFQCKFRGKIEDELTVEIKDNLCKRYMARGIKNVKIAPSPGWMQERLIDAGVRPINNIVDITNFVMLEIGQPMHAFDRRQISSSTIIVDRAKDKEKFVTLDGIERELDSDMLTIRDGERAIGLAGIMGGLNSEIEADTTEVIFESANFEGVNIRINSKKLGIRTEASSRYEKEIDPNLAQLAIDRACNLVQELNAGEIMEGTIDIYNCVKEEGEIEVDYKWINSFLGTNIEKESMKKYLDSLELKTLIQGDILKIKIPTFRVDIGIKEDIAEEVARIYGYDNIPITIATTIGTKDGKNRKQKLEDKTIETLLGLGINQSISYSFVSPKIFDKIKIPKDHMLRTAITIKNPLGEDYSIMRTTTIGSMMDNLSRNYSRNNDIVRLFEIGKVYLPKENQKLPKEVNTLTIGLYGNADYLDLKGIIEGIIEVLGIDNPIYERHTELPTYHPGKTANLFIGGQCAGILGEIHPEVSENYDIEVPCYVAELNLDIIFEKASMEKEAKALPKFPAVTRDIAILVNDDILVQTIENIIIKQGGKLVEEVKLFDVYRGKQIPKGKKSVAYNIIYRDDNKTLTDKDVNKIHEKILKSLEYTLNAELR